MSPTDGAPQGFRAELARQVDQRILDIENAQLALHGDYVLSRRLRGPSSKVTAEEMRQSLRAHALKGIVALAKDDPTLTFLKESNGVDPYWNSFYSLEGVVGFREALLRQIRSRFGARLSANQFEQIGRLSQDRHALFLKVRQGLRSNRDVSRDFIFLSTQLDLPKDMAAEQLVTASDSAILGEPYEVALLRLYDSSGLENPKSLLSTLSLLTRVIGLAEAAATADGYYDYVSRLTRP